MSLKRDDNGNVAIFTAVSVLPILFIIGLVLDFTQQQNISRAAQVALDQATVSVALRLQEDNDAPLAELTSIAQQVFDGNLSTYSSLISQPVTVAHDDTTVNVTFSGAMTTGLSGIMGHDSLAVELDSAAQFNGMIAAVPLDIALVLDVSLSMEGERIDALRAAANDLVDLAMPDAGSQVQIGIVPFNGFVNVGLSNRGESWLTEIDDESETSEICPFDQTASEALGCTFTSVCEPANPERGCYTERVCPAGVSLVRQDCFDRVSEREWLGCVKERDTPLDITDGSYNSDPIEGVLDDDDNECRPTNQILPLTSDKVEIKLAIDNLTPIWQTYIPSGIIWGQRILSPEAPFEEASASAGRSQAIILLSDGANTGAINPSTGLVSDNDPDEANERLVQACDAAKAADIRVFTIAFSVDDRATRDLLEDCASEGASNFDVSRENELTRAFSDIVGSFQEIALTE